MQNLTGSDSVLLSNAHAVSYIVVLVVKPNTNKMERGGGGGGGKGGVRMEKRWSERNIDRDPRVIHLLLLC